MSAPNNLRSLLETTNRLLRKRAGEFTRADLRSARDALQFFNVCNTLNEHHTNKCVELWERVLAERSTVSDERETEYFAHPDCYNPILAHWKRAVERGYDVVKANDLFYILQTAFQNGSFTQMEPVRTYSSLMAGLVKQAAPKEAPLLAQAMLDQIAQPHILYYNTLLSAWKNSGRPERSERIEAIQDEMARHSIEATDVTRRILVFHYLAQGDVERAEKLLDEIKQKDRLKMGSIVTAFAENGQLELAEHCLLRRVLPQNGRKTQQGAQNVVSATLSLLDAYIRILADRSTLYLDQKRAVEKAESIEARVRQECALDDKQRDSLTSRMIHLYGSAQNVDSALAKYRELVHPNILHATNLVISCGRCERQDLVLQLFHEKIKENPDDDPPEFRRARLAFCNAVLMGLGFVNGKDAFDAAMEVFETMKTKDYTRPDRRSFSLLLRALSRSGKSDIPETVEKLFGEMKKLKVVPDRKAYSFAITGCMAAGDLNAAAKVLDEMEQSNHPPSTNEYNQIILAYAKTHTAESARHVERILDHMWQKASSSKDATMPNTTTYSLVMSAWMYSSAPKKESAQRVIELFRKMKERGIPGDYELYRRLVNYLTKLEKPAYLRFAEQLLTSVEEDGVRKDHRIYTPIMNAWIKIGDVEGAERVFQRRVEDYMHNRGDHIQPVAMNFFRLVKAWIDHGEIEKARDFIAQMAQLHRKGSIPEGPNQETIDLLEDKSVTNQTGLVSDACPDMPQGT